MKLTLEHRREGHTYDGRIVWSNEPDDPSKMVETITRELDIFTGLSFARMMARFSGYAMQNEAAELVMRRTERDDLKPITLDETTTRLLREDPAAAIEAMSSVHQISERAKKQMEKKIEDKVSVKDNVKLQLRAGHDTLADAFGDLIYLRLRPHEKDGMQGECPFTGKWVGFGAHADNTSQFLLKTGRSNAHVDWIPIDIIGGSASENPKWVTVKTAVLLNYHHRLADVAPPERFFIPRKWNKTSPWITHVELRQMYKEYKKEKAECLDEDKG